MAEQIAQELIRRILNGELLPGQRVTVTLLQKDFGTSQAPIREALLSLERQGFVVRIPRKGTYVRIYTLDKVSDEYDVRYILETYALERAIKVSRNTLISMLGPLVTEMKALIEATAEHIDANIVAHYQELNTRFHQAFFTVCANDVLTEAYLRIYRPLTALRRMSVSTDDNLVRSFDEHRQLFENIKSNDIDRVLAILRNHHYRALESLKKLIAQTTVKLG